MCTETCINPSGKHKTENPGAFIERTSCFGSGRDRIGIYSLRGPFSIATGYNLLIFGQLSLVPKEPHPGRDVRTVFPGPSMEPRPFGRGNYAALSRRSNPRPGFNGATSFWTWKSSSV